uniref:Expressed conserved protein n=1 Tax=Echinococcus granulosus TaxID=6210 RepID=A0A068WM28_ECHGR|nr:hypothetical protein EgrG_001149100 [Echinococcus granulosus]
MVVGGVINTGEISGGLDLQADIEGDLGFRSRGVLGGLINTGFIGGGVNVRSSVEGGGGTGGGRNSTGGTGFKVLGPIAIAIVSVIAIALIIMCIIIFWIRNTRCSRRSSFELLNV